MKKLVLGIALMALMAGAAHAYTKVSPVPDGAKPAPTTSGNAAVYAPDGEDTAVSGGTEEIGNGFDLRRRKHPTRPVPEPGTMALASMGLLALGAAARKRRGH